MPGSPRLPVRLDPIGVVMMAAPVLFAVAEPLCGDTAAGRAVHCAARVRVADPMKHLTGYLLFDGNGMHDAMPIANTPMFMPFGYFLFGKRLSRRRAMIGIGAALTVSVGVELTQAMLRVGYLQLSDVMYNKPNGAIGVALRMVVWRRTVK